MKKRQAIVITCLGFAVCLLAFLNSSRLWWRFDLTQKKVYTLSKASKELFKEIDERVTITYYLSDKLASKHPIPGEISDLLNEYAAHSRGRIRLVIKDPIKTNSVAAAERLGVMPQQIETLERDESTIATVYTGLVIEYLDKTDSIPVVFSLDNLEYDLTARIRALVRGTRPEIAIIIGSEMSWNEDFSYLAQYLSQSPFDYRLIAPGDEIPDNLSALIIFGGTNDYDDWALYRLDRYIQLGGKVIFAVEGVKIAHQTDWSVQALDDSQLLSFLEQLGIGIEPYLVLDKNSLNMEYQTQSAYGFFQWYRVKYPLWPVLINRYASSQHPLTNNFEGLDLFWASPLRLIAKINVQTEILASTSPEGWLMTKDFIVTPDLVSLFSNEAAGTTASQVVVAALSGTMPSYFHNKPKPLREGSDESLPDGPLEPKPSRIVVVGDSEFATNLFRLSGNARNITFLFSALDWLSHDEDILAIRARAAGLGRLDKINDPEQRARYTALVQVVNVGLIPVAVLLFAVIRALRRRRRNQLLQEASNAVSA